MDMDTSKVLDHLKELMSEKDISRFELSGKTGVPLSTIYNMMKRRTMPSIDTLDKLCTGLNISLSQFFNGADEQICLNNDEKEFVLSFRQCDMEMQGRPKAYLDGMKDAKKAAKKTEKKDAKKTAEKLASD